MDDKIYFEILGRMIAAYDAAPKDDNPLSAIQMFARIAADYVKANYVASWPGVADRRQLLSVPDAEPDADSADEDEPSADDPQDLLDSINPPMVDPLSQVTARPIQPADDIDIIKAQRALHATDKTKESNHNGGGMTAKPNAKSAEQFAIKFSERESDLLGLMKEHPEMSPKDYAEILDTSIGNIYAIQHSIRKKQALLTPKKV